MTRVLMFGWEFPPFISGGLGTACFGLTESMRKMDNQIHFVLPSMGSGENIISKINLIDASKVPVAMSAPGFTPWETQHSQPNTYEQMDVTKFQSLLTPYDTFESYQTKYKQFQTDYFSSQSGQQQTSDGTSCTLPFTGKYGPNLKDEVFRLRHVGTALGLRNDFDIIHAHDWMTYPGATAAKEASGKPMVAHVHATEFDRSGTSVNQEIYDIERAGMHAADHLIAVSHRTKDIVINHYGISPEKVTVVHNGVIEQGDDKEKYQKKVNEKIVLFLGRVTQQKGPIYFVEAAAKVIKKHKNVRFVIAGDGDLLPDMIKRVAKLKIQDKFHFTGFLRGDDINHMFSISDLCVMPSVSEPFGIVPIEAIRFGLPVIVSKQSGVSEVLEHAMKIDFWDVNLLTEMIEKVVEEKPEIQHMIHHNREVIKELGWDEPARKVNQVYERVLR